MQAGLHTAFLEFLKKAKVVQDEFNLRPTYSSSGRNAAINATLNLPTYKVLSDFESYYLQSSLTKSAVLYGVHLNKIVSEAEYFQSTFLWIFITLILFSYVFVVQRLIFALNNEVRRTRSLLLMIPSDVLTDVSAVRKFIMKQYRQNRI